jgi:lipopolysaccharide biosynthesis glycosyltransferase
VLAVSVNGQWTYKGLNAAIVTAADEAFAHLLFDLCDSLKPWQPYLHVIDIGLSDATLKELARRKIEVATPPSDLFDKAKLRANYIKALYLRPSLPDLFPADIIMWIDADCWVQRQEAVSRYFDCALEFPDKFTLCHARYRLRSVHRGLSRVPTRVSQAI